MTDRPDFSDTALGKRTAAVNKYSPSLLYPIERSRMRLDIGVEPARLPFKGCDLWTAYELTWLDQSGKPDLAIAHVRVPCHSQYVFESKSFKLYLGSFTQTRFKDKLDVTRTLESDLSVTTGADVMVTLQSVSQVAQLSVGNFTGFCLDHLKPTEINYQPSTALLEVDERGQVASETVYSNLLRTLCPVTTQPDFASIQISYSGKAIKHESLLAYLISFREYEGFHEHCVERIFTDLQARCAPAELSVYARYTRRGGIDINPYRSTTRTDPDPVRLARQ